MIPKVSIIVPVHNAGIYFCRCLDALVGQTLKDIEIILVLDCPADGSDKVAEQYARQDNRIRLIYNETNLHIGFSRNRGLEAAQGEYIGFSDHDDYCEPTMFEALYNKAKEEDTDLVISDFADVAGEKILYYRLPMVKPEELRENIFSALIEGKQAKPNSTTFSNVNSVWTQIIKNKIIQENDIRFNDTRQFSYEDAMFNLEIYHIVQKVYHLPHVFYYHVRGEHNAFNSYQYRSIENITYYLEAVNDFLKKNGIKKEYEKKYAENVLRKLYSSFRNELNFKGLYSIKRVRTFIKSNETLQEALQYLREHKNQIKIAPTKRFFLSFVRKGL